MVTIDNINIHLNAHTPIKGWIDSPTRGQAFDSFDFNIVGWAIADNIQHIMVFDSFTDLHRCPVNLERLDVLDYFRTDPAIQSLRPGFSLHVNTIRLPTTFHLRVILVHDNGAWTELGNIDGHRQHIEIGMSPTPRPVLLNTIGRSGTTWLMSLLKHHPAMLVAGKESYEVNLVRRWLHHFLALTNGQASSNYLFQAPNAPYLPILIDGASGYDQIWLESEQQTWMMDNYQAAARYCEDRIGSYYRHFAKQQHKEHAIYFVEKFAPRYLARNLLYNLLQIAVVRDPRDTLCSVYAFNAKRGFASFAIGEFPDERAYLQRVFNYYQDILREMQEHPNAIHLVRYEDMATDLPSVLEQLFAFLQIENSRTLIRHIITTATSQESDYAVFHQTSPTLAQSIGRWKTELSAQTIALFRELDENVIEAFNYSW